MASIFDLHLIVADTFQRYLFVTVFTFHFLPLQVSVYKLALEDANNDAATTKSRIRLSTNFSGMKWISIVLTVEFSERHRSYSGARGDVTTPGRSCVLKTRRFWPWVRFLSANFARLLASKELHAQFVGKTIVDTPPPPKQEILRRPCV